MDVVDQTCGGLHAWSSSTTDELVALHVSDTPSRLARIFSVLVLFPPNCS